MVDVATRKKGEIMKQCVGCGFCCLKAPCEASVRLYKGAEQCPQLIWTGPVNRYLCGLMTLPEPLGESYRKELYANTGCCSGLNSWRNDVKNRHHNISDPYQNPIPQMLQIFLKCWAREFISSDVIVLVLSSFIEDLKKANYSEKEIELIKPRILHYVKENRQSYIKEFMG